MASDLEIAVRNFGRRVRSRAHGFVGRREEAAVLWARTLPGWFSRREIELLYRTVHELEGPGDVAEVGSWKGRSTVVLGRAVRDAGIAECRIFAIDHHVGSDEEQHHAILAREKTTLEAFRRNVRSAGVAQLVEEMVMPSAEAARVLADRGIRLRLAFIDGAHDAESVRADIRAFLPLLRSGGLMAFHDCLEEEAPFPGVWEAYRDELQPRADEIARADSLLVVRPRGPS